MANFKAPPGIDALPGVEDNDDCWHIFWTNYQYYAPLDKIQTTLGVLGMIPGYGAPFDGLNAVISLLRGNVLEAALSFAAAFPILEWFATGGKWSAKAAGELVEHGDDAARLLLHNADDVAVRAASVDFAESSGRLGGRLWGASRISTLKRYLEKRGVEVLTDQAKLLEQDSVPGWYFNCA